MALTSCLLMLLLASCSCTTASYSCDYLASYLSLTCYCTRYQMEAASLATLLAPRAPSPVESLVLQNCHSVRLHNLSTTGLEHHLYQVPLLPPYWTLLLILQVRLEQVDRVELGGGVLGAGGLELGVRGAMEQVVVGCGPLFHPDESTFECRNGTP